MERADEDQPASFSVLASCGAFEPGFRAGGPIRSMAHIVDTLPDDVRLLLVTSDRDLGDDAPYPGLSGRWVERGRARVFYLDRRSSRQWIRLWRDLRRQRFDVVYLNSLFSPTFSLLPVLAVHLRLIRTRAVLVAPRGELSPGALAQKSAKKLAFLRLWRLALGRPDVFWQSTSALETAHITDRFPHATVVANGNQSGLPARALPPGPPNETPRLVYVGRISPKKNLAHTLAALAHVPGPVSFDIYGPVDDDAYWRRCQELMAELPPEVSVTYRGAVRPDAVRATFADYDAFVFPTLGENFGHVIAESLSSSCPVVTSDETPWSDVLRNGGGYVLDDLTVASLSMVLTEILAADAGHRQEARERAGHAFESWRAAAAGGRHLFDDFRAAYLKRTGTA